MLFFLNFFFLKFTSVSIGPEVFFVGLFLITNFIILNNKFRAIQISSCVNFDKIYLSKNILISSNLLKF